MKLLRFILASWLLVPAVAAAQDEAGLRAADEAQRKAAVGRDVEALAAMTLPDFHVNSPEGDVGTRERMLGRFSKRQVGHDAFNRIVESATITGNVGVVMGREVVIPSADSIAGQRRHAPSAPVLRRFTNVWLWQAGAWKWLARHANEVVRPPAAAEIPKDSK